MPIIGSTESNSRFAWNINPRIRKRWKIEDVNERICARTCMAVVTTQTLTMNKSWGLLHNYRQVATKVWKWFVLSLALSVFLIFFFSFCFSIRDYTIYIMRVFLCVKVSFAFYVRWFTIVWWFYDDRRRVWKNSDAKLVQRLIIINWVSRERENMNDINWPIAQGWVGKRLIT